MTVTFIQALGFGLGLGAAYLVVILAAAVLEEFLGDGGED